MGGSRGGGTGGPDPPHPPEKSQNTSIGFLSNTGPDPLKNLKSYLAYIQCWAIIGTPAKRRLINEYYTNSGIGTSLPT